MCIRDRLYAGAPLEYISVSDYNKAMESQGNKPVSIHNKEAFFISAKEDILDALTAVGDAHKTISVYGHKLKLVNARETSSFLCTSPMPEIMLAVVVPDAVCLLYTSWSDRDAVRTVLCRWRAQKNHLYLQ